LEKQRLALVLQTGKTSHVLGVELSAAFHEIQKMRLPFRAGQQVSRRAIGAFWQKVRGLSIEASRLANAGQRRTGLSSEAVTIV
jgi:hypothetical protein